MPAPSRWMIRLSLMYLLLGMGMGAVMLIHKAYPLHPAMWQLLPIHIEITIFGWIIQFTLGTGYWMLPRFLTGQQRGPQWAAIVLMITLNMGILFTVLDDVSNSELPLQLLGRCMELLAVIIFISLHWRRIVTYRSM